MGTDMSSVAQTRGTNNVRGRKWPRDGAGTQHIAMARRQAGVQTGSYWHSRYVYGNAWTGLHSMVRLGRHWGQVSNCRYGSDMGSQGACTHSMAQQTVLDGDGHGHDHVE